MIKIIILIVTITVITTKIIIIISPCGIASVGCSLRLSISDNKNNNLA